MANPLTRIFLSSTIYDLKDLRNSVQMALQDDGYAVLASEAGSIPVDSSKHSYDICLDAARQCECLVAIIDSRFGGVMPDGQTSITLAEIEAALANGRQVLAFVRQGVWDAKEVYNAYKKQGQQFTPTKLVEDERVFHVIDEIRQQVRGNWIFQFNLPEDLIYTIKFQLNSVNPTSDGELLGHIVIVDDQYDDPQKRFEVRGFPESFGPAVTNTVRDVCAHMVLDTKIVYLENPNEERYYLFGWKEIHEGMVDPSEFIFARA